MMLLPCLLLILSACVSATQYRIPRLSPTDRDSEALSSPLSDDFKTFYYNQTLDHFNYRPESYTTFAHRYIINFKYWGGANSSAPILAYLGAEGPLDNDLNVVGFSTDNAAQFGALLVYIEVRAFMFLCGSYLMLWRVYMILFCFVVSIVIMGNRYPLDQGR